MDHTLSLKSAISRADIVSFDVFDTLLSRPFARPTDVFWLARTMTMERENVWVPANWPEIRICAEHDCYQDPEIGPDILIDDIYDKLVENGHLNRALADILRDGEIQSEIEILEATERGKNIYSEAINLGKVVIITSDMYLPKSVIETALSKAGYSGWSQVIVSGEDKLSKHSGKAFVHLKHSFPGKKILHIGDNRHSDFETPRKLGCEAVRYLPPLEDIAPEETGLPLAPLNRVYENNRHTALEFGWSLIAGLITRWRENSTPSIQDEIGFSILGPVAVAFSQWLHSAAFEAGVEKLVFLSRDGAFLQKAYQAYWGSEAISNEYLYISRRMARVAGLRVPVSKADVEFLTALGGPISLAEMILRFFPKLSIEAISESAVNLGFTPDTPASDISQHDLEIFIHSLESELAEFAEVEKQAVVPYLLDRQMDSESTAIVDIGWQGSIQETTAQLANNPSLQGFYFSLHETPKTSGKQNLHAFIDPRNGFGEKTWHDHGILNGIEVIEFLFGNPSEASVRTILRQGKSFMPVFTGERLPTEEASILKAIQESAIEFVMKFKDSTQNWPQKAKTLSRDSALANLGELLLNPTYQQASCLGKISHDNTHGVRAHPLAYPARSKVFYKFFPRALEKERAKAWWKPGFDVISRNFI